MMLFEMNVRVVSAPWCRSRAGLTNLAHEMLFHHEKFACSTYIGPGFTMKVRVVQHLDWSRSHHESSRCST